MGQNLLISAVNNDPGAQLFLHPNKNPPNNIQYSFHNIVHSMVHFKYIHNSSLSWYPMFISWWLALLPGHSQILSHQLWRWEWPGNKARLLDYIPTPWPRHEATSKLQPIQSVIHWPVLIGQNKVQRQQMSRNRSHHHPTLLRKQKLIASTKYHSTNTELMMGL